MPQLSLSVNSFVLKKIESAAELILRFLEPFEIIPFGDTEAEIYSEIRADLEKKGKPIGPNDLLITATVISHNGTLITNNEKEFKRIQGLRVENWVRIKLSKSQSRFLARELESYR